jgi:chemotaxis protein CheD
MFSASSGIGAICHAMLPENLGRDSDLRYVDTALQHIYDKIVTYGIGSDLVVKLFGGAQVLNTGERSLGRLSVGDQNIERAEAMLASLGLVISARDTGGLRGRRLFFCTRSGDVYMRFMRHGKHSIDEEMTE